MQRYIVKKRKANDGYTETSSDSDYSTSDDDSDDDNDDDSDDDNESYDSTNNDSQNESIDSNVWETYYNDSVPYYYNTVTGETTWDNPNSVSVNVPSVAVPQALYMYRFWTCEVKGDPCAAERKAFIEDTKLNESLCSHGAEYFTDIRLGLQIWMLHDDASAAAMDTFPPLASAVALANTDDNYLSARCIVPNRGWSGLGKVLFKTICEHLVALGYDNISNMPANDKLEEYYKREYGMTCFDDGCTKALSGYTAQYLPVQTHMLIMSAEEAAASKAAADARAAARAASVAGPVE